MSNFHQPVLLDEVIAALEPTSEKKYIDGTFGGGGHSRALLIQGAKVLGLDRDQAALEHAKTLLEQFEGLKLVQANFTSMAQVAEQFEFTQVDGILLDLGVSSWQLDSPERGFSFQSAAELDMRMDTNLQVSAKDLLAALGEKELTKLFQLYGDEPKAKQIAHQIIQRRKQQPLTYTQELVEIISRVYRHSPGKIHPATKVFQALRIAVNDELNNLKAVQTQMLDLLKPGGKMAIISFHSGEDRIVKQFLKQQEENQKIQINTKKPIVPTQAEIQINPRSRSAKLRIAQKL